MLEMTINQARQNLAGVLQRVSQGERILLRRHNQPVAAIVSVEDLRLLEEIEDHFDREAIRKARAEIEREGTVSWEQVKKELDL